MDDYAQLVAGSYTYGCEISYQSEDDHIIGGGDQVRKGLWTVEEDAVLSDYINIHGEGRWNAAARGAGLNRTGKSCRLRWLNYLRPNVRRGNITLEEQLLILELHSRWGNRWSKIAQFLPGRTDNEIKNYWRTRVQKHAKQLKCDVNSKQFRDAMRYVWMPRLVERIQAAASGSSAPGQPTNHNDTPDSNMLTEFSVTTSSDSFDTQALEYQNPSKAEVEEEETEGGSGGELTMENFWNEENIWFLQQQLM